MVRHKQNLANLSNVVTQFCIFVFAHLHIDSRNNVSDMLK